MFGLSSRYLADWLDPRVWRDWWKPPRFRWWWTPSGGKPGPWSALEYLASPIVAHSLFGVWATGLGWVITGGKWSAYGVALALAVYGQIQKGDALVPTGYDLRNMLWRTVITAVTVPLWLIPFPYGWLRV